MAGSFNVGFDLQQFDESFKPAPSGDAKRLENLPNGDYEMEIMRAEFDKIARTNDLILRLNLEVLVPSEHKGREVEYAYFFRNQESVDRLGNDLLTLGFDSNTWNAQNGKKFSAELPRAVALLPRRRFAASKMSNANQNKTYHNLRIKQRLPDGPVREVAASEKPPW